MPADLERRLAELTRPVGGQFPRPWITDLSRPETARVFVVGRNQATAVPADRMSHREFMDSLFNRDGRSSRLVYDDLRAAAGKGPSATRRNLDALVEHLHRRGIEGVIETNVVCYSTPMSADLAKPEHRDGRERGAEIFRTLLEAIRPRVVIAHGEGTRRDLARLLGHPLPRPAGDAAGRVGLSHPGGAEMTVLTIPSLAPPGWNRWSKRAPAVFADVADAVARCLEEHGPAGEPSADMLRAHGLTHHADGLWLDDDGAIGGAVSEAGLFVGWVDVGWPHPATPVHHLRDVEHVPPLDARLDAAVAQARERRAAALRRCGHCGRELIPGHMHWEDVCQRCAEQHLGVVY